jgi:hypothetical protein
MLQYAYTSERQKKEISGGIYGKAGSSKRNEHSWRA